jgi:dTDP-4-amino-4,6-dideoxygalactose transaminase
VHYAGLDRDMEKIMFIALKHILWVAVDAAQAIYSYFTFSDGTVKALGYIVHLTAFSFHKTKNIISGEGGMLDINDFQITTRAEIIWEKGTNRSSSFRGDIDKYGWVDVGSSFLPTEITAAFLWAQLEELDNIQSSRSQIWNAYLEGLTNWAKKHFVGLPEVPGYATNNAHMFYLVCPNLEFRDKLISSLKNQNIHAVFHYQSLHKSPFYQNKHDNRVLIESDRYTNFLVRLPMWFGVDFKEVIKFF